MTHESHMQDVFEVDPPKPDPVKPATVRDAWEKPVDTCPECGAEKKLVAFFDIDELYLSLDCPDECVDPQDVEWPWVESCARSSDCKALGFEVV